MPEPSEQSASLHEDCADGLSEVEWARIEQGCRRQDSRCFEELVTYTEPRLRRLFARLCGQRADVDELVQETFLRAWQGIRRFRGDSRLSTWLTRIALNVASNWRRDCRPTVAISPEHYEVPARTSLQEQSLTAAFEQALGRLASDLNQVFVLHETEGLSYKQIAEVLQCPIGTVMSRLHRARQQLLGELRERLDELMP